MKIHLAWIRVTAAAAIAASAGVYPAAAQYAPYRPIPQTPAAPATAAAAPPTTPYVAYRPQPAYQSPITQYQPAPAAQYPAPTARYQAPTTQFQQPATQYQQPVAQYQQPAAQYQQPITSYPQTASQYPTGGAYAYVAQATPTEALPAPAGQPTSPGPGNGNGQVSSGNGQVMPSAEGMPADPIAAGANGYPGAGCGCNGAGYAATTGSYTAAGCGCNGSYPEISQYMNESCGNENQWFGGVYFLYMTREHSNDVRLTTEIETGTVTYPYYPPASTTVVSSQSLNSDFAPGVEVRFGSTFTIGDSCGCQNSCGYTGCGGCGGCQSCRQPTMYAWEVAWWGLDNDSNDYVRQDTIDTRLYGMQSFAGIQVDRDNDGTYVPVNNYYDYQMPIDTPDPAMPVVLAQRVYTNFRAQNLELNIIRFPMVCDTGCSSCGTDACGGCGSNYTGCNSGCGCDSGWNTNFSMYGSCGVRYFRVDDDFGYDTEFDVPGDGHAYDGFSGMPDANELCYDINIDNNLIGPQVGWTSNYCIGCRWNFFCNSTFGVFDNQMNQTQRVWGSGDVQFVNSGETVDVRSHKNDVAFLGELRVGGSYDFNCHCRGVLAYRAIGLSGIATSVGQIPSNFSDRAEIAQIDSDSSMVIHGVQTGIECRY